MKNNSVTNFFSVFLLINLLLVMTNIVHASNSDIRISVSEGYIKANIPGSDVTAAYMTISNTSAQEITLQKVTSPISPRVEIHEHSMNNGMMRMREVNHITIEANSDVVLQPSGLHLMIFSVKQQINTNETVPFTLYFSDQTKLTIQLPVFQYK